MVYAYDTPVLVPVMDLYDNLVMAMAISAAKDMYDKGLKQMEDFYTKYGDFMSPFAKDMEWYGLKMGAVRDIVNQAYANGIDLFKSPEGRMLVTQLSHSIDPKDYNNRRANAAMGYKYLEAVQKAISDNTYSKEFEDYLLQQSGLGRFEDFSSDGGRVWNRPGPGNYQTIDDLIEPIVKNVDFSFDEALTKSKNDGNNYYTITRDRLMQAVNDNMSDILATQSGGFHYWKALLAANGDKDLARLILNEQIANRLSDREKTKFEADPFKLDDYRTRNDIYAHRVNAQVDYENDQKKEHDWDNNGEVTPDEIMFSNMYGTKTGKKAKAGAIRDAVNSGLFQYGDAQQDQATMKIVDSLMGQLTETDPLTGKTTKVTVLNARPETVENAYSRSIIPYRSFMRSLWNKHRAYNHTGDANDGVYGNKAFNEYLNRFGFIDTELGFKASVGENSNSSKLRTFSAADISNIYTDAELLAMCEGYKGFKEGYTHEEELKRSLRVKSGRSIGASEWNLFSGENASGVIEGMRGSSKNPNTLPVILPDGSRIIFRAVNIKYGTNKNYHNSGRLWIPVGSPTVLGIHTNTKTGRRLLMLILPYTDQSQSLSQTEQNGIYTQLLGGQQHQNVSVELEIGE